MQHKNCTPIFDLVPRCQVSRCPPLLYYGLALSSLAMSVPTILMVSRCPVPRFQSPRSNLLQLRRENCRHFPATVLIYTFIFTTKAEQARMKLTTGRQTANTNSLKFS